jgi:excisionase family DNA binding protein
VAEYLTTKEVAAYLRLNEKKVYALVAAGQLPASRISGKWLFPRHIVDQWVEKNTRYPSVGLMGALLDDVLIIQGSDDWLFSRTFERYQAHSNVPVVSASVGSLAGISAVTSGKAHMAGCHVDNSEVEKLSVGGNGCYLVNLFSRDQGLMFDAARHPELVVSPDAALPGVHKGRLRFAERQPLAGTYRLGLKLFEQAGVKYDSLSRVGPFTSHLELALAIRNGEADAGLGAQHAALQCGLDFVPLHKEPFKLVVPADFASQPQIIRFLDFVLAELRTNAEHGVPGYGFDDTGRMETIGAAAEAP